MGNATQRFLKNERKLADPIQRERYKKIYNEIIGIFVENKCTVSETLNILSNLRKGISAAETVCKLGIDEDVMKHFNQ